MKFLHYFIFFFILKATIGHATGQDVPIGQWKDYLSYQDNLKVCQGQNTMYCTSQSGIFSYNLSDNSTERYNRVTGLSDVSPSVARFNPYNNALLIGYTDGNIDILQNNQITNISALATTILQGSKVINDIYFSHDTAYLSCGQGVIQVDMTLGVILNKFKLNSSGNPINVYNMIVYNDSIFAATAKGIYKANFYANLDDYHNWQKINAPVLAKGVYNAIALLNNKIYVNFSELITSNYTIYDKDTIYLDSAGVWKHYNYVQGNAQVSSLESTNGYLVISTANEVKVLDKNAALINDIISYGSASVLPSDAITDAAGNIWIADQANGLVKTTANNSGIFIFPPGPFSNYVTAIAVENNDIWITPGGYNQSDGNEYLHIGVSAYLNNTWYSLHDTYDTLFDINCIAIDPHNPAHAFAGSWYDGVIEYTNNTISKVYNTSNSSLQFVDVPNYPSVRVGGLAYDTIGNLWVTNAYAHSKYLSVMKTDGTWQAFDFSNFISPLSSVTQIIVTKSNAKWMAANKTGLLVFQDNGTFAQPNSSNAILINTATGNGALPSLNIYAIAEDLNGTIWIGTDQSVVAFYSPDNVLDGNHDWDAQPIYVNQNGYTQYLMQNQLTTAIAVDGANRKWIGTQGGGVFLMSADGTQQVYNFTTSNSPLLSNNISAITINPVNGEVFFATDKGVVSFRGTATEGGNTFGYIYTFPNPVPHDYTGVIAVKGLISNSDVKITTVNGELVYHTTSLGGQAIWDGNNFSGKRVQTGVYLVFCVSPDGSQSTVTKLLFLN